MSRGFEGAGETANEMLAEAVAKQLRPVYCIRCGSRLQVRKLQQNGFDKDTGYPKYDVILGCPHVTLYETRISRQACFTWKDPLDRHTVHKVSKVMELNSDIADAYYNQGLASFLTLLLPLELCDFFCEVIRMDIYPLLKLHILSHLVFVSGMSFSYYPSYKKLTEAHRILKSSHKNLT